MNQQNSLLVLRKLALSILFCGLGIVPASAFYPPVSVNPSFEDEQGNGSLQGWNWKQGLTATIIDRPTVPTQNTDAAALDYSSGTKMIRLQGTGGFGQTLTIGPNVKKLLFNVNGYASFFKTPVGASAIAQVTFYDASWKELSNSKITIGQRRSGLASGLGAYSVGVTVPAGAANALLFVWNNDPSISVFIDSMGLFDFTSPINDPINDTNLITNNNPGAEFVFSRPFGGYKMWAEFWTSSIDYKKRPFGITEWGSLNQTESAYQVIPIAKGNVYRFSSIHDANMFVGFDHYDASWNRLSKVDATSPSTTFVHQLIVPPADATRSSLYFYVPQGKTALAPSFQLKPLGKLTNGTSFNATYRGFGNGRRGSGTSGWVVDAIFIDLDGVDTQSITADDFYVTSKSDPNKRYPVELNSIDYTPNFGMLPTFTQSTEGKYAEFAVHLFTADPADYGVLVLKPNAIKDKTGNFVPAKSYVVPPIPR